MLETGVREQVPALRVKAANFVREGGFDLATSIGVPLDDRDLSGLTKEDAKFYFGPFGMGIAQKPLLKKRLFGLLKYQPPPEILLGNLIFCADRENTELSFVIDVYGMDNEPTMRVLAEELAKELNIPFGLRIVSEESKRVTHLGQSDFS